MASSRDEENVHHLALKVIPCTPLCPPSSERLRNLMESSSAYEYQGTVNGSYYFELSAISDHSSDDEMVSAHEWSVSTDSPLTI